MLSTLQGSEKDQSVRAVTQDAGVPRSLVFAESQTKKLLHYSLDGNLEVVGGIGLSLIRLGTISSNNIKSALKTFF